MTEWLNTNLGSDTATYLGLFAGIVALFIGGNKYKKWKQNNINQNTKNIRGDVSQAGRDINNTTNNNYSGTDGEAELIKKQHDHDLKIIEEILTLLPYKNTIHQAESSYITGMFLSFSSDLEEAEKFSGEEYTLYDNDVEYAKSKFINAIKMFNESHFGFLSVDHPERKPPRLDLPYNLRDRGGKDEEKYREYQNNMRETSGVMNECYKNLVTVFKRKNFITDKL
ncbi:hypothetical protein P4P73_005065 [Salmonella enterica]|nr:hypothetical protein [Salmonella enterica]